VGGLARLRTLPNRNLPPGDPPSTTPSQVLSLENQTMMDWKRPENLGENLKRGKSYR